jgi:hypothetical protein
MQDKAGFPASGTSFLSFCLHIALGGSPTFRRDARAAHFPIIIHFQRSESRRPRRAASRRRPYLRWRRYFHAASRGLHVWSCAITFDIKSSSDAQRRRLSYPSRQGPRSWWRARNSAPNRRGAGTPDQLRRRGPSGDPARWRQSEPGPRHREGRRQVQRAGPGRCNGVDA